MAAIVRQFKVTAYVEFFFVLGYYAAWSGLKPTFRLYLSVSFLRVKLGSLTLEDGADR